MEDKTILGIFGLGCLTTLASIALYKNIDGTLLASVVGVIGTIVGYAFGVKKGSEK